MVSDVAEPLSERKAKILATLLRYVDGVGFNELCHEVKELAARQTVKNELDELIRSGLVVKIAGRKGQKVYYVYKRFEEVAKSINKDLEFLELVLEGLRRRVDRIEKKVGEPLEDITNEDVLNPVMGEIIDLLADGFANAYMIAYIVEAKYPPRLREPFIKKVEEPFRELSEKVGRTLLLNRELLQKWDHFVDKRSTWTRKFLRLED